jgi:hypothetical protein
MLAYPLSLLCFSCSQVHARSALARFVHNAKVVSIERVATLAMRLSSVGPHEGVATAHVFPMGNGSEMIGVYASALPANMINLMIIKNNADELAVSYPVCLLRATTVP